MSSKHKLSVKVTELGPLPESWETVRLKDISFGFISGGTPSTKNPAYWDGDIPWMTSAHINGRTVTQGVKCITEEGLKNSATNVVPKNNILIATRVGIGKVAVNLVDMTISQDLTGAVLDHKKADVDFVYWLLSTYTTKLKSLAQGSTIKGLLRKEIENLKLPLPPLPEQRRIAEILTTADTAIRKVDDAIAKTERLKRGLMQELLTKGAILGFMFDTTVFGDVLDNRIDIEKFSKNQRCHVTHIQHDEISKTPNETIRRRLLDIFQKVPKKEILTEGFVLGMSRLGKAKLGTGSLLEAARKGNLKHTGDALIGDAAIKNGLILVTDDRRLRNEVQEHGGWAITLGDFLDDRYREFKDSEVGRIPRGWGVVKLGSIAKLESGGTPSRQKSEYWESGTIPWVKSGELNDGVIYETEEKITELGLKKSSAKLFYKETLFIALYGRGTVSKTAILGIDAATNQAICAIIPVNSSFDSKFMQQYLIFSRNKLLSQVVNPSSDVGRTNIYLGSLKLFKLPCPPLPEQIKIAEILSTIDKKLELERKRKKKLEGVKKGLMNCLLSGKVRVKND